MKNFKSFQELEDFEIKPVTILCGTNSSGKSSLLQSILLLKQSIENRKTNQGIVFNGKYVHLGSFENVIYNKDKNNKVEFKFCFKIKRDSAYFTPNKIPILYSLKDLIPQEIDNIKGIEYFVEYRVLLQASMKRVAFFKPIIVDEMEISIKTRKPGEAMTSGLNVLIKKDSSEKDVYEIKWNNILKKLFDINKQYAADGSARAKVTFTNLIADDIDYIDEKPDNNFPRLYVIFYRINDLLETIMYSYSYIGPLREEPSRRYIYENEIVEIGVKGENAAYLFETTKDLPISNHFFYDKNIESFSQNKTSITLSIMA